MKKALLIVGGLAVLLAAAVTAIGYYIFDRNEVEKNRAKTEPARQARWKEKETSEKIEEPKPLTNETASTSNL
jgi:hypothetical protein